MSLLAAQLPSVYDSVPPQESALVGGRGKESLYFICAPKASSDISALAVLLLKAKLFHPMEVLTLFLEEVLPPSTV